MKPRYIIPGMLLGGMLTIGGVASAFYGGGVSTEALDTLGFSDDQKTAITRAFGIRAEAEKEARTILEQAGVDEAKLHDAMRASHAARHDAFEAALEAKDYEAFRDLVSDMPGGETLTPEVFAKLAEAHTLREEGSYAEARALLDEVKALGFDGPMMGKGMRMHGMHKEFEFRGNR